MKVYMSTEKTRHAVIDLKDATILLQDGNGARVTVTIGEGNLQYTVARNIEYRLNRGLLDEVREGDEIPMDVSFDAVWEEITGGSVTDIIKGEGSYVSSDSDACRPYACDVILSYDPSCGGEASGSLTFADFRYESLQFDVRAGTISCSGKCNSKAPLEGDVGGSTN